MFCRAACHAGKQPKRTPLRNVAPKVKSRHGYVEVRIGFVRDAELISGHKAHDSAKQGDGEQCPEKAAHQRQGKAFDQELAEDARAGGTLRGADGDFFLPRSAPGEQQVRDIDAGDQEDEADRSHHEPEAEAGLLGKKVVFEGLDGDGEVFVRLRIGLRELLSDDGHFGVGGFESNAAFELAHYQ